MCADVMKFAAPTTAQSTATAPLVADYMYPDILLFSSNTALLRKKYTFLAFDFADTFLRIEKDIMDGLAGGSTILFFIFK